MNRLLFLLHCLLLCGKRQLRLTAFRAQAIAFVALTAGFLWLCPQPQGSGLTIGILFDPQDAALSAAFAPLEQEEGISFRFYRPGEEDQLHRDLLTQILHCGYLIDPAADPPVTIYETDGSYLRPVADQLVFAALFETEAPLVTAELLAASGADPALFSPGEAGSIQPEVLQQGLADPADGLLDLRPLFSAVLCSLLLFFGWFGGLFSPADTGVFSLLERSCPGAGRIARLADALACTLLLGLELALLLVISPSLRGLLSPAAFVLLTAAAAALHRTAAALASRFPRGVLPALLIGLLWTLVSVCFSGALIDPTSLPSAGILRFLSPAWLLSRLG